MPEWLQLPFKWWPCPCSETATELASRAESAAGDRCGMRHAMLALHFPPLNAIMPIATGIGCQGFGKATWRTKARLSRFGFQRNGCSHNHNICCTQPSLFLVHVVGILHRSTFPLERVGGRGGQCNWGGRRDRWLGRVQGCYRPTQLVTGMASNTDTNFNFAMEVCNGNEGTKSRKEKEGKRRRKEKNCNCHNTSIFSSSSTNVEGKKPSLRVASPSR